MAETEVIEQPVTMTEIPLGESAKNPFADSQWTEAPPAPPTPAAQPAATTTPTATTTPASQPAADDDTFDEAVYLKNNFGWESAESAKAELERLRALEKVPKPEEIKFANDESRRIFDLIKSNKPEDKKAVRDYLDRQDRLDRLTTYDLSKADQAADILKAHLQFKNPDLTSREVDRLMNRKFTFPEKPVNNLDLTPEENQAAIQAWEQKVREVEEDMIIEAKLVRPELAQFKSQLVLPDINYVDPAVAEAQQKELQEWQSNRANYLKALDDIKNFTGFSVNFKDATNGFEFAVPYGVAPEEATALKGELSDFNRDKFFDERWFDKDGKPKVTDIASDIYFLKNKDKIFQKLVNESAAQLLVQVKKQRANITVGTQPQGTFQPDNASEQEKQERAIWSA